MILPHLAMSCRSGLRNSQQGDQALWFFFMARERPCGIRDMVVSDRTRLISAMKRYGQSVIVTDVAPTREGLLFPTGCGSFRSRSPEIAWNFSQPTISAAFYRY